LEFLDAFAQLPFTFVISAGRHLLGRYPLGGFSWNSILRTSMKICRKKLILLKTGKIIGPFTWRPKYVLKTTKTRSLRLKCQVVDPSVSVRMHQRGSQCTDLREIWYGEFL